MRSEPGDKARIMHILEAIKEIEAYTDGIEYEDFESKSVLRFASIKQLEIIGEASNHLSQELLEQHQEVPWAQIVALRNVSVHEYFGVSTQLIWQIIKNDIEPLKSQILQIHQKLNI